MSYFFIWSWTLQEVDGLCIVPERMTHPKVDVTEKHIWGLQPILSTEEMCNLGVVNFLAQEDLKQIKDRM